MTNPSFHSGPCAAVDHRYWSYMVVWCPHRQQFTLTAARYLETGTDADPSDYTTRRVELGPFDNRRDVVELLMTWVDEDQADEPG
jgi:hypothetical protein